MTEKYLLFNLDDEKSKKLGDIISNPTCKKIVNLLAEKELSETDISKELKLALNTTEYNLKKLLDSGIIEKSKNHFWSVKGKKIETYKVANKLIVISPNKSNVYSKLKTIVPVFVIAGLATIAISFFSKSQTFVQTASQKAAENATNFADKVMSAAPAAASQITQSTNPGIWFGLGSLLVLILFLLWTWKKLD